MIRFLKITFLSFLIATSAIAGSDGELELSKKNNSTKDCFEPLNRATFALNQGLDKAFFKPVAKGYRSLPSPIKKGTGNVLNNLSTLITIPNNVLQGDLELAAKNTARFTVNTTIGILGLFVPATKMGLRNGNYYKEGTDILDRLVAIYCPTIPEVCDEYEENCQSYVDFIKGLDKESLYPQNNIIKCNGEFLF